jgi:hypothetical protein
VGIARGYSAICRELGIRHLDFTMASDYNGYKFVVLDPLAPIAALRTGLTEHPPTSGVFDCDVLGKPTSLPHWCPPTYASLATPRT